MVDMFGADRRLGRLARAAANVHRPGSRPSIALLATPRSGSTWVTELIRSQPGFKSCDEPLNLRNTDVVQHLGISEWDGLHDPANAATIEAYFEGFLTGRLHFMDHRPFRRHHRWRTNRVVFRVLHGMEDKVAMLQALGLEVVHLIRHPLAVARSRRSLPRLEALTSDAYLAQFDPPLAATACRLAASGSPLEQAVLSWCLQNKPLLDAVGVARVTYEQLVLEPGVVIDHLASRLDLPKPERMMRGVRLPSASSAQSAEHRRRLLSTPDSSGARLLVESWMSEIADVAARRAMAVASAFDIDIYRADSPTAVRHHVLSGIDRTGVQSP